MSVPLISMREHISQPRQPSPSGAVVLSQLPRGSSLVGSPTISLKMVLEGEERYEINGRVYRLQPGSFLYLEQGANCEAHLRSSARGVCIALPLGERVRAAFDGASPFGHAMLLPVKGSFIGKMFYKRALELTGAPETANRIAPRLIEDLNKALFEQAADMEISLDKLGSAKLSTRQHVYSKLEFAKDLIHSATDRSIDLSSIASEVGLSQYHFARYFKALYGKAPIHYHRSMRLARAATMLLSANESVLEVALATGYSDQVALNHAFKKEFGMAPGEFRQKGAACRV